MTELDGRTALVLGGLATWRVSHLLASEDGPMQAVVRLRQALDHTPIAGVMDCFACTSVWVGAAMVPVVLRGRVSPRDSALIALGLSAAACLIERLVPERPHHLDLVPEPELESPFIEVID